MRDYLGSNIAQCLSSLFQASTISGMISLTPTQWHILFEPLDPARLFRQFDLNYAGWRANVSTCQPSLTYEDVGHFGIC